VQVSGSLNHTARELSLQTITSVWRGGMHLQEEEDVAGGGDLTC